MRKTVEETLDRESGRKAIGIDQVSSRRQKVLSKMTYDLQTKCRMEREI